MIVSCPPGQVPEEGGELEEGDDGEETKGCHHPQVPVDSHRGASDTALEMMLELEPELVTGLGLKPELEPELGQELERS